MTASYLDSAHLAPAVRPHYSGEKLTVFDYVHDIIEQGTVILSRAVIGRKLLMDHFKLAPLVLPSRIASLLSRHCTHHYWCAWGW